MRILLVEDNPMNLELETDLLELHGHEVFGAGNAEEGLRMARELMPDLILMDVSLPGMDGLEATHQLHQDPTTHHLRVVALTAHAMPADEERARQAGCCGYITKPIDTRTFVDQVESYQSGQES
ncbi:MAG: hypothetical protein AMXMBFR33_12110 [Candidatus Xenobia bacterium]